MKSTLSVATLAVALAACGHATPAAAPAPAVVEPSTPVATVPAEATPAEATPVEATPEEAPPDDFTAPAAADPPAPSGNACVFTAAKGKPSPGGISVVGLPEAASAYDMPNICPVQACSSGLTVDLSHGDWAYGVYDVTIAADTGTLRCHVTAKAPPAWTPPASCAHQRELSAQCVGPQELFMGPVMISGAPAKVRFSIKLDGKVLADQTLRPSYSNKRWDGFDCDPSCVSATGTVSVR